VVNRYETYGEIASGGMATVEYGRLFGPHGFSRPVAIKRLHAHFAKDPNFATMFLDEARLSARLLHANIIPTLDVIDSPGEIALVMEYVHGEDLSSLLQHASARAEPVPIKVAAALVSSVLHGLHAAHETRNERDELLGVVHRDVSPHNILVGVDGVPRILDFGIAKAVDQLRSTPSGEVKGKLAYIAPEQLRGQHVDRRADVFGAAAVLWETLTGFMLFQAESSRVLVQRVLGEPISAPSVHVPSTPAVLDAIVMRGLERDRERRYPTAREMALELERKVGIATQSEVSDWLQHLAGDVLRARAALLRQLQEQGGVPLLGAAARDERAAGTRVIEPSGDAQQPDGSTPPSIETRTHATEVRSVWPWLVAGLAVLVALGLFTASWLRDRVPEPPPRQAASAPVAPQVAASPETVAATPAEAAVATPAANTAALAVAGAPAAPAVNTPPSAASTRKPARAAKKAVKASGDVPAVKPAAIAPTKCAPVIYVDGIRRINPDCAQGTP
jgi:eukaryotic-like serine/threonine-protein kinase